MKCADPVLCYTGDKKRVFRHFSLANPSYKALPHIVFNCGKCVFCRKKRASELAMRCVLHASLSPENCFITLTYDEKNQSYHNNFEYSDIQKFKKRLRQKCRHKKIQIFNVHEYGRNGKKHWHLVVFNHDFKDKKLFKDSSTHKLFTSEELTKLWPYGYSTVGDVTEASAMYQAQYTQKDFKYDHVGTSKKSHSKHSGIGREYFIANYAQILCLGYIPFNGKKVPIPRYFEKIAHKHWCHFNDQSAFFDQKHRKRLYTPFKIGEENLEISLLYGQYVAEKKIKIEELALDWENVIQQNLFTKQKPEFAQAASNYLSDLKKKSGKDF